MPKCSYSLALSHGVTVTELVYKQGSSNALADIFTPVKISQNVQILRLYRCEQWAMSKNVMPEWIADKI